jgi:hypothetical protein
MDVAAFINRWESSAAAERANCQLFLSELCDVLDVPRPEPSIAGSAANHYVFERAVTIRHPNGEATGGRIDLYKQGCFVLEAKQGSNAVPSAPPLFDTPKRRGAGLRGTNMWDEALIRARLQAERYAKSLPNDEGWPPFLIVADVGNSLELYADFSGTGKAYVPFPDALNKRIVLAQLHDRSTRETLRKVWLQPESLDPARISARVTREVAERLAELAKDLEKTFSSERVAAFLMRCIFTFFAEDIHLLPRACFTNLIESLRGQLQNFPPMVESLWRTMDSGGFSPILREHVLRFNGGLFETVEALPLNTAQFERLCQAAKFDWTDVEPAIFGTLLERALNPAERHKLGAHYTPRAYVERLVIPTVIEPLREDWRDVQMAALTLQRAGKPDDAIDLVLDFQRRLCAVEVLDPACGSGNFLYVTLEHLKRLEGEVVESLEQLGEFQQGLRETGATVDPHQLKGIELNPHAAAITDLVLWIGYLQWYFRTWGASSTPPEPVINRFHNIEYRDALLSWDSIDAVVDAAGKSVTQWDGVTRKRHPVTGEEVPDEAARRTVWKYNGAKRADWPSADFIVGNPPFLGNWRIRGEMGDGYAETLRSVYGEVTEAADYVMYWWHRAAELVRGKSVRRFGFITTNSLKQTLQRRVITPHLLHSGTPASLVFAIPDHPWVDSSDGAAVRIAMTVAAAGDSEGLLLRVVSEAEGDNEGAAHVDFVERRGKIHSDLSIGPNTTAAVPLKANGRISSRGVSLHGAGFIVSPEQAEALGLGRVRGLEQHIRPYLNGRDLTATSRNVMVIDLFGLADAEVRTRFPEVYQWLFHRVKPERDAKRGGTADAEAYAKFWWLFGKTRSSFRPALKGLRRYISTVETAKHRIFVFLDAAILPDNMLVNIATDDAFLLGVLSSRLHVTWALAAGGTLEDRPRYNKTRCFEPFPFPGCTSAHKESIRSLAESIDAHRKRQQALHPDLTLTNMYNVLAALREGRALYAKERQIHDEGLISVLRELHDHLDIAVAAAYGWPADLTDEEILFRLVDLNAARAAEERNGSVQWLRPEYQKTTSTQAGLDVEVEQEEAKPAKSVRIPWPAALPSRVRAIRDVLYQFRTPATPKLLARSFAGANAREVEAILDTLVALGQAAKDAGEYRP